MASTAVLIGYILAQLEERGFSAVKTALVKLLYLCDVEGLRSGLGRVSDVQWVAYKYGPYAAEIDDTLRKMIGSDLGELRGVSASGRAYIKYGVKKYGAKDVESWESELTPLERAVVARVLDRWAGESLEKLLDYVYFETEPMLEAEWGKPLRMELVRQRVQQAMPELSAEAGSKILELAERLKAERRERKRKLVRPDPPPRYDDLFYEALHESEPD